MKLSRAQKRNHANCSCFFIMNSVLIKWLCWPLQWQTGVERDMSTTIKYPQQVWQIFQRLLLQWLQLGFRWPIWIRYARFKWLTFEITILGNDLLPGSFLSPDFLIPNNLFVLFFGYIWVFIRYILYKMCIISYTFVLLALYIYIPIYVYVTNQFSFCSPLSIEQGK